MFPCKNIKRSFLFTTRRPSRPRRRSCLNSSHLPDFNIWTYIQKVSEEWAVSAPSLSTIVWMKTQSCTFMAMLQHMKVILIASSRSSHTISCLRCHVWRTTIWLCNNNQSATPTCQKTRWWDIKPTSSHPVLIQFQTYTSTSNAMRWSRLLNRASS